MQKLLAILISTTLFWLGTATAEAQTERVLRINENAVGELDPHIGRDYADSMLAYNVYDYLVRPKPGGDGVEGDLAIAWSSSEDGLQYTFTLRTTAKFHDGSPVLASDVVFSANRLTGMQRGFAFLFDQLETVEALDDHTVRFTLNEVSAPFVASLVRLAVVNEDLVMSNRQDGDFGEFGDYGRAFLSRTDAGSGAYFVVSHDPQALTVMRKFADHHLGHAPRAPDIVRIPYSVPTPTARTLMLRGEHEITREQMPSEVYADLHGVDGISLAVDRQAAQFQLKFNTQKPPTDDVHFRRAMAAAFDYESVQRIIEIVPGIKSGSPSRGPLPSGLMGYDDTLPFMARDMEKARAELAQSRYRPDEHPVEILWIPEAPIEEKIALLFQLNMRELGINVNITKAPWALLTERAQRVETTPNVSSIYISAVTPDSDSVFWQVYHSSGAGSWASMEWLQDPEIDEALEEGRRILDPQEREAHYKALSRTILDLQPAIFGYDRALIVSKQDYVDAPSLQDPAQASSVQGHNYVFRNYEILN